MGVQAAPATTRRAPAHVPPDLVYDFAFQNLPGMETDVVRAAVGAMRGLPDIFYTIGDPGPRINYDEGFWVVSRSELMREIFQDPATFTSRNISNFAGMFGEAWRMLPLEVDPPEHGLWRMVVNPIFSPRRMKALEAQIDRLAIDLIEGLASKTSCDFATEFAGVFPIQIFLRMFGLPLEETAQFVEWERMLMHSPTMENKKRGAWAIIQYLRGAIGKRRAAPTDDLISDVVTADIEGRRPTDDEALGFCFLLYSAGLDTVAAELGYLFKHLAEHPADQQKLRENPDLIPNAVEEVLRVYAVVITSRHLTRDIEFHGVTMKKGDRVRLPTMAAGRDDRVFPHPDVVDFARENTSSLTFGAGPHRCVGSHLARRELRIALEHWLARMPPFHITPGLAPVADWNGAYGIKSLPLSW